MTQRSQPCRRGRRQHPPGPTRSARARPAAARSGSAQRRPLRRPQAAPTQPPPRSRRPAAPHTPPCARRRPRTRSAGRPGLPGTAAPSRGSAPPAAPLTPPSGAGAAAVAALLRAAAVRALGALAAALAVRQSPAGSGTAARRAKTQLGQGELLVVGPAARRPVCWRVHEGDLRLLELLPGPQLAAPTTPAPAAGCALCRRAGVLRAERSRSAQLHISCCRLVGWRPPLPLLCPYCCLACHRRNLPAGASSRYSFGQTRYRRSWTLFRQFNRLGSAWHGADRCRSICPSLPARKPALV